MRAKLPWNISSLTIAGAVAALEDVEEFEVRMKQLRKGRDYLERELASTLGLSVISGEGNFVLLDVAKTGLSAEAIVEAMLTEGVYIRSLSVHHAKRGYVRVTVGTARTEPAMCRSDALGPLQGGSPASAGPRQSTEPAATHADICRMPDKCPATCLAAC